MPDHQRRTFSQYKAQVLHALGNPDAEDLDISPGAIVNDAIEHIATMHEWQWLSTGQQALDITAGKNRVELPADFGTLLALHHENAWSNEMIPTTWDQLVWLRKNPIKSWTSGYFYVIQTGNLEGEEEGAGLAVPTLELYPTPAENESGAIHIVYRRFLRRLEGDDDQPQWPAYLDRPLSLLARAFATTDYEDTPESAYSAEFRTLIADCMEKDGLSVGSFGVGHGAVHQRKTVTPFGYPDRGIPNPTNV